ncbi:hypothetical protein FE257_003058 [Aspergillus nanangensis]|uniref:Uncharacterized protein n=1 Tax=Aspergillus nanangensis TaxID=2582783 RepID=A0AAD4CC01_ASPNN|nr:hypothetical protein FE257_003058 [Aspergillus nanangensis]
MPRRVLRTAAICPKIFFCMHSLRISLKEYVLDPVNPVPFSINCRLDAVFNSICARASMGLLKAVEYRPVRQVPEDDGPMPSRNRKKVDSKELEQARLDLIHTKGHAVESNWNFQAAWRTLERDNELLQAHKSDLQVLIGKLEARIAFLEDIELDRTVEDATKALEEQVQGQEQTINLLREECHYFPDPDPNAQFRISVYYARCPACYARFPERYEGLVCGRTHRAVCRVQGSKDRSCDRDRSGGARGLGVRIYAEIADGCRMVVYQLKWDVRLVVLIQVDSQRRMVTIEKYDRFQVQPTRTYPSPWKPRLLRTISLNQGVTPATCNVQVPPNTQNGPALILEFDRLVGRAPNPPFEQNVEFTPQELIDWSSCLKKQSPHFVALYHGIHFLN